MSLPRRCLTAALVASLAAVAGAQGPLDGGPARVRPGKGAVLSLAWSSDGKTLFAGREDGKIDVWDMAARHVRESLPGPRGAAGALALSSDGKVLASAHTKLNVRKPSGVIMLWDVATGRALAEWEGHPGAACCLAFAADGKRIASGGTGGTVLVWDVESRAEVGRFDKPVGPRRHRMATILHVQFSDSEDGFGLNHTYVEMFDAAGRGLEWELRECAWKPTLFRGNQDELRDGEYFLDVVGATRPASKIALGRAWSGMAPSLELWLGDDDGKSSPPMASVVLRENRSPVICVALSPDRRTIATGHMDGTVQTWDVGVEVAKQRYRRHLSTLCKKCEGGTGPLCDNCFMNSQK